jgi:hypothetical protein
VSNFFDDATPAVAASKNNDGDMAVIKCDYGTSVFIYEYYFVLGVSLLV